jgi:hypothetical protein
MPFREDAESPAATWSASFRSSPPGWLLDSLTTDSFQLVHARILDETALSSLRIDVRGLASPV